MLNNKEPKTISVSKNELKEIIREDNCECCSEEELEKEINNDIQLEDRDYTKDEVEQIIQDVAAEVYTQVVPKVELNLDNISDIRMDKNKFIKGVSEGSFLAGLYTSLKSVGLNDEELINQLMLNYQNCKNNIEVNEQTCKNNISISKIQDKQMKLQLEKADI